MATLPMHIQHDKSMQYAIRLYEFYFQTIISLQQIHYFTALCIFTNSYINMYEKLPPCWHA
jgi:hypothetical protein